MDIQNVQFVLRPRRVDEVLDFSVLLLRENFRSYAKLLALPLLFFFALNSLLAYSIHEAYEEARLFSIQQYGMLLVLFVEKSLLGQILVLYNGRLLFEKSPGLFLIWKEIVKNLPVYVWHQIVLRGIYLFVLWPLFVFPFRSLVQHFFKSETLLLEGLRGKRLRKRLQVFASGLLDRVWVFLMLDFLFLFVYLFFSVFAWNQLLDLFSLKGRFWWLDADIERLFLSPVISLFVLPYWVFHSTAKFLFYIDLRSLKEGWDIELQLQRGILAMGLSLKKENL